MYTSEAANSILGKDLLVGWSQAEPVCSVTELLVKSCAITVLCGPNGAGKSTLLKTLAGLLHPLSGSVLLNGKNIAAMSKQEMACALAYVPQFSDMRKSLSVEDWVSLGRNPHQKWWSWTKSPDDQRKIEDSLKATHVVALKDKLMNELSGGERQRVLIATALAQDPHFLLLDEPTAHLDFRHQLELCELLQSLRNSGLGILLVLHDLDLTARLADSVVLLEKNGSGGRVVACGNTADVLSPENLRAVYGVEMQILKSLDGKHSSYLATALSDKKEVP